MRRGWALGNPAADRWVAAGLAGAWGVGTILALGGAASQETTLAVAGGLLAAMGLLLLLAAGWIDPLTTLALSTPLPTLFTVGGARVAGAAAVAALVAVALVLRKPLERRAVDVAGPPVRVLTALALWLVVVTVASPTIAIAVRESVSLLLLIALLVGATDRLSTEEGSRERIATALAALASACGFLAVLETVGVIPGSFERTGTAFNRATLGFGQPNALGLFLAVAIPFVVWRAARAEGPARAAWRVGLVCAVAGLIATFSRGGWAAAMVGALAFVLAGQWRIALRVFVGTLVALLLFDVASGGLIRDTFTRTVGDWVVDQRLDLTFAGLLMFRDHPLLGVGPGGFEAQIDQYGILLPELFDFQPTPHNAYVQMAAEAGALGAILYVALLVALMRGTAARVRAEVDLRLTLDRAILWSLGALVVSGLFIWPLAHGVGEAVILILAMAAASGPIPTSIPTPGSGAS